MFRLLSFLYAYRNTILFLFLEGIALLLIIQNNTAQRLALGDALLEMSISIAQTRQDVVSFFGLKDVNRQLLSENQRLKEQVLFLNQTLEQQSHSPEQDSVPNLGQNQPVDSIYKIISCNVIRNTTDKAYNYITLNKGSKHNIKKDMGVLSPEGIAGRIIQTTPNFSVALSALNRSFKLSVKTLNKENVGVYEWPGKNTRFGLLKYIPSDIIIQENDTVVTSGYSYVFPPDYMVGIVDSVGNQTAEGFYEVRLKLATDFRKLNQVYVIENLYKSLLDSLEASVTLEPE